MCIQPGSAISPATGAYDTKNAPLTSTVRDLEFTISRFESGAQCDKHWLRLDFVSIMVFSLVARLSRTCQRVRPARLRLRLRRLASVASVGAGSAASEECGFAGVGGAMHAASGISRGMAG